jgi:hypothetical protein
MELYHQQDNPQYDQVSILLYIGRGQGDSITNIDIEDRGIDCNDRSIGYQDQYRGDCYNNIYQSAIQVN